MTEAVQEAPAQEEGDPLAPVVYTVRVTHGWDGEVTVEVQGIADPDAQNSREAMALALRLAVDAVEKGETRAERRPGAPPNVVSLRGGDFDIAPQSEPDPGLVKALAQTFRLARDGKLKSFIGTGLTHDGMRMKCFGGPVGADVYQMLGALAWLQHEYVDRVVRASDVPTEPKGAS